MYVVEPVKSWAGVKNNDGGVGELDRQNQKLDKDMSDLNQQEQAYRIEQAKTISTQLKTGKYSYDDFEFALKGINISYIDEAGKKQTKSVYDYLKYVANVKEYNQINNAFLNTLDKEDYTEVTGIQSAINSLNYRYELFRQQKGRIEDAIESRNEVLKKRKKR
ncbi:MAG: hypothetical protein WDA12_02660 [Bacilli bacterium]